MSFTGVTIAQTQNGTEREVTAQAKVYIKHFFKNVTFYVLFRNL